MLETYLNKIIQTHAYAADHSFERRRNASQKPFQQTHLTLKSAGFIPKKYFRNLMNNFPCDAASIGHKKAVAGTQHVAFAR